MCFIINKLIAGFESCKISISSNFVEIFVYTSSIIRQKGESQNRCLQKTKHAKFSEKQTFLTPWYARTCAYQVVRNVRFFRKIWRASFSWNTRFDIRPFALLPTTITGNLLSDKTHAKFSRCLYEKKRPGYRPVDRAPRLPGTILIFVYMRRFGPICRDEFVTCYYFEFSSVWF